MRRIWYMLPFLLVMQGSLSAQRHGRADGLQNYIRSTQPRNPELVLDVQSVHKKIYLRASDLRKMKHIAITATDSVTKAATTLEGVSLEELVPIASISPNIATLELDFGFHPRRIVSDADLDPESKPIVADTINREAINRIHTVLFCGQDQVRRNRLGEENHRNQTQTGFDNSALREEPSCKTRKEHTRQWQGR